MSITPLTRFSERRGKETRCYTKSCPHYYKDDKGILHILDLSIADKTSTVGDIGLREKGIASIGLRKDSSPVKFLGVRPDETQKAGTEQLEFTIEKIVYNGKEQPIDTSSNIVDDQFTTDLGSLKVRSTRIETRQLFKANNEIKSFEIQLKLHVKGLTVQEKFGEFWFYAGKEFRFKIKAPLLVDSDYIAIDVEDLNCPSLTIADLGKPPVVHSLTDNKDGTFTYKKNSTDFFTEIASYLPNNYYIDADIYYSTIADGYIFYVSSVSAIACRDAATGTNFNHAIASSGTAIGSQFVTGIPDEWRIRRSFFYYDLSAVGTIASVSNFLHGITRGESSVTSQQGTQAATITTADYDSFSGSTYGSSGAWNASAYNEIVFNAQGITDCNAVAGSGEMKVCSREAVYDSGGADFGGGSTERFRNGVYFSDNAGTDFDPYLSIVEGGPVTNTKTFTIDAFLQASQTKTFTIDAFLQASLTKTFSVDAFLQASFTKSFAVDAILTGESMKMFTVDAFLQASLTKTFSVDAFLQDSFTKTFTVDAFLQASLTKTFAIDAFLQATQTKSFAIDAVLISAGTKTFIVDAFLQASLTKTFALDAILESSIPPDMKSFAVDAFLLASQTKSFGMDAILYRPQVIKLSAKLQDKTFSVSVADKTMVAKVKDKTFTAKLRITDQSFS